MSIMLLFFVVIGFLIVIGCGYWVMSGSSLEGGFRVQPPNLRACPQCGATLDPRLDQCPKCSLRVSV